MFRVLNFGSVNIDHVYSLDHFVRPGETLAARSYRRFSGGKGFNQSTALARAGAAVSHAGAIGADGAWLRDALAADGADVSLLRTVEAPTGHAVIQVDASGQNCILIDGGANRALAPEDAERAVEGFGEGDVLLVQNETSVIPETMRAAKAKGMRIAFNPAPMDAEVAGYPLGLVDLFIVNETEADALARIAGEAASASATPLEGVPESAALALAALRAAWPQADVLLTLGAHGAVADVGGERVFVPAAEADVVDTTAAGDTFIGYFLASRLAGASLREAMETATAASAFCISHAGAAPSIPRRADLRA